MDVIWYHVNHHHQHVDMIWHHVNHLYHQHVDEIWHHVNHLYGSNNHIAQWECVAKGVKSGSQLLFQIRSLKLRKHMYPCIFR